MDENKKTLTLIGAAVVLAGLALLLAPKRITPEAFLDQGAPFFPEFTDPNEATSLEVIDFDSVSGTARPFKVEFADGRWSIPSHHNYPADGKDRLAKTAAGVIGIKKDDFRSDNVADHEACGVIDPLDAAAGLNGRGQRVTIRGGSGQVLSDVIFGKAVEGREGFRFARVPDQKRVYAVRANVDISTEFKDWIESDLLQVDKVKIDRIQLRDYSINERTLSIDQRENFVLEQKEGVWKANNLKSDQQVDSAKMQSLLTTLDDLTIVGVRPKPPGISASLRKAEGGQLSQADLLSLQSAGFYLTRDGQLMSNEGELQVHTKDGVNYTLRFGEVVYGSGLAVTAGTGERPGEGSSGASQNRYLFLTAEFDPGSVSEPKQPTSTAFLNKPDSLWTEADRADKSLQDAHDRWQRNRETSRTTAETLNARFAGWYYVISAESFQKLRLQRKDIVVKKEDKPKSSE
ncbi:MAG TPA: DUF4340 domain-containing protein [Candidatus Deferrimicrobium sp.]|nr:DUF4340 domain-containing protein [Candidatus Deferrimicrobium sp.]